MPSVSRRSGSSQSCSPDVRKKLPGCHSPEPRVSRLLIRLAQSLSSRHRHSLRAWSFLRRQAPPAISTSPLCNDARGWSKAGPGSSRFQAMEPGHDQQSSWVHSRSSWLGYKIRVSGGRLPTHQSGVLRSCPKRKGFIGTGWVGQERN